MSMFGPPAPEPGVLAKVIFTSLRIGVGLWVGYGLINLLVWMVQHLRISII